MGLVPIQLASKPDQSLPRLRLRRNPRLIAIGALAVCVGGLGTAMAYQQTGHTQSVVVVAKNVPRGQIVGAADLSVTTIGSAPEVAKLPAAELSKLIGQEALVDLMKGELVGEGAIGRSTLPAGTVQLGLKLGAGRLPTSQMPSGTPIVLVSVADPKANSSPADATQITNQFEAHISRAPTVLPDGSTWTLDIVVNEKQAANIAILAASDRLVVMRKAGQ